VSGGQGFELEYLLVNRGGAVGAGFGSGQDLEADVAAAFGPLVVLLGQDGADQPGNGGPLGKMPTTAGRRGSRG
jgi:hypothetical protein